MNKNIVEYDIWKIIGAGRQAVRYYESYKNFTKYWTQFKNIYGKYPNMKAFRFTNKGWIEIKCIT